jgi:hypothetical protein
MNDALHCLNAYCPPVLVLVLLSMVMLFVPRKRGPK